MSGSISGCVLDETSGERLTSPDVRLYRIGVPGETVAVLNEHGCFSFTDLSQGEYSLAVYDPQFVTRYESFTLSHDEIVDDQQISLAPGGFLSGQILDEEGRSPERCWFTLLRAGEREGRSGYVNDSGDHRVSEDGTFCSPPLLPAKYLLRFAGILRKPIVEDPSEPPHLLMQRHLFDFLYSNAHDVAGATGFDVQAGQKISGLQMRIPRPVWHTVRGKVMGDLHRVRANICVMFTRDIGTIDGGEGAGGASVQPDGKFEYMAQSGRYSAEVCEFTPPEPTGRTYVLRRFGTTTITVADDDLSSVEIHLPPEDAM